MALLTPQHFQKIFECYRGEPQQVSAVWQLYAKLGKISPLLLDDGAEWFQKFREAPPHPNPLHTPYQSQRDNYRDANRTCFSSSCAMLLMTLKPGAVHSDDDYIRTVFSYGDTTEGGTQVKALAHYGVQASFITHGDKALIKRQIDAGIPVPCGFLHHGTPQAPSGGGHWCCVIGYDESGVFVNDPWGECDLSSGTYPSANGCKLHYSDANWTNTRWMADGPGTGWCIVATQP
jgi:hypothetical protein